MQLADVIQPGNATAYAFGAMENFKAKGGKLLHYHGLSDGLIPTGSSQLFYNEVLKAVGKEGLEEWYRFFEVPGMHHCFGTADTVNAPW